MSERAIADLRLGTFSSQGSRGLEMLHRMFPSGEMTRRAMYSFASILGALANVRLERDFSRRKDLLVKWFDDNYDVLEPFLHFVELIE
jgi:hypothetical protein